MIVGVTAALVREMLQSGPDSPNRRAAVFGDLRARVQGRGRGPAPELETAIAAAWQKGYVDGYEDGVAAGAPSAPTPPSDSVAAGIEQPTQDGFPLLG